MVYEIESGNRNFDVIIVTKDKINFENLEPLYFGKLNYYAAKLNYYKLLSLLKNEKVLKVYKNEYFKVQREYSMNFMGINQTKLNFNLSGENINISIVDTGVYPHEEFENRIILQKCFISHGTTKCPPNNLNESNNATDDNGHGTHVAGIAAGKNGVANASFIFAIKVLNSSGVGELSDLIKGINFSVSNGAQIISLSLGSSSSCYEEIIDEIIDELTINKKVLFVIAAGNEGPNNQTIASPACSKTALAVGAIDKNGNLASFSSRGPTNDNRIKPDIVAVGVNVNSTYLNNSYKILSGTSMAAPFVSGTAALIYEYYFKNFGSFPEPGLVKAILINSANGNERNNSYGSGILNATEAIRLTNKSFFRISNENKTFKIIVEEDNSSLKITFYQNNGSKVNITFNNKNYFLNETDNVKQLFFFNLSKGVYNLKLETFSNETYYFVSSNKIGSFKILSPENKSYNKNVSFNITVDWIPSIIKLFINGVEYYLSNSSLYDYFNDSIVLNDGNYLATFVIDEFLENVSFTIDTIAPKIELIYPANNSIINNSLVTVNFTISELANCYYILNSEVNQINNCNNFSLILDEGNYNLTLVANDSAGNENRTLIFFNVSLAPRYFNFTKPIIFINNLSETINISTKWIDKEGLDKAIVIRNDSNEILVFDLNNSIEKWINISTNISSKVVQITIFVNDTLNKTNSTTFIIIFDNLVPFYKNVSFGDFFYGVNSFLNITIEEDYQIDKVLLEANFTGDFLNYSVENKSGNVFYYIIDGKLNKANSLIFFRWHFNDSASNYNFTEFFNYTVKKFPTNLSLLLNNNNANLTVVKGSSVNIKAFLNTNKNLSLDIDGIKKFENNTFILYNLDTSILNEGNEYNITSYYSDETENYTFSFSTLFLGVCPACPSESFSSCTNNLMIRTYYICNKETNFLCKKFEESVRCFSPFSETKIEKQENITKSNEFYFNQSYAEIKYLKSNETFLLNFSLISIKFYTISEIFNSTIKVKEIFENFTNINLTLYKSFEIDTNLNKIKDIRISFNVSKDWIRNNRINVSTISLFKIKDDYIEKIFTRKLFEDDKFIVFESELNGFSKFLIAGEVEKYCDCPIEEKISKCEIRRFYCDSSTNFQCIERIEKLENCIEEKIVEKKTTDYKIIIILISIFALAIFLVKYFINFAKNSFFYF